MRTGRLGVNRWVRRTLIVAMAALAFGSAGTRWNVEPTRAAWTDTVRATSGSLAPYQLPAPSGSCALSGLAARISWTNHPARNGQRYMYKLYASTDGNWAGAESILVGTYGPSESSSYSANVTVSHASDRGSGDMWVRIYTIALAADGTTQTWTRYAQREVRLLVASVNCGTGMSWTTQQFS